MVPNSNDYIEWLSLVKPILKVVRAGKNCSLVARTSKCGWAISHHLNGVQRGCKYHRKVQGTRLNITFSITKYLESRNAISIYCVTHIFPTNVKSIVWTL